MTKTEWDALRYPIELQQLSKEEGGGWMAWIPQLGRGLFMADADTAEEAIADLETLRRDMYDRVMASGQPITLPLDTTDAPKASGKWLQRAAKSLHAELKVAAENEGVSFNSYVESCIQRGHMTKCATDTMRETAALVLDAMRQQIEDQAGRYEFKGLRHKNDDTHRFYQPESSLVEAINGCG